MKAPRHTRLAAFVAFGFVVCLLSAGAGVLASDGSPGSAGSVAKTSRPNILFILADQQRSDALGVVNPEVRTPALDRLAKEGVRFDRTYVAQALCTPSRASIFSGLYPHFHGLDRNVYNIDNALADPQYKLSVTWPKLLRDAGYHTAYLGKWHLGDKDPGCFNEWGGYNSLKPHWLGKRQQSKYRSDEETDQAIEFLQRNRDKTFALCVSYYPPHTPYDPPEKYEAMYEGGRLKPAGYWGAVTAIDDCVSRVLGKLDALGLRDNTLVIFTADHGDHFGKRPGGKNKEAAYDEASRVPLIVRLPGVFAGGKVQRELVSSVDLMPTILEAARVPAPANLQGTSLASLPAGHSDKWRTMVCVENREDAKKTDGNPSRGIRTERYKLILRHHETEKAPARDELYDLQADPREHDNLFGAAQADTIRAILVPFTAWAKETGDKTGLELADACRQRLEKRE